MSDVVGRIEFGPASPRTYTMGVGDCTVDVVRRSEYDALAARLAEAERLLSRAQPLATQKLGEEIYKFLRATDSRSGSPSG